MKQTIAITAMSGIFPGVEGPVGLDGLWNNIQMARPAKLHSLQRKWDLRREDYFDPKPGVPYRTYLDAAHLISDCDVSQQVDLGKQVIRDLFLSVEGKNLPAASRLGLCVATLWCDPGYFAEDARRVIGASSRIGEGSQASRALGPDGQIAALAEAGGIAGPQLAIDAACASSLYALDTAIGLIEQERIDAAVVMGLNGFLPPLLYFGFSKLTALSPKAQILPFSAEASGIIPSETIAAVLIEPLTQALREGRQVLAVIRGLGLSADGGDRSVFAPSPRGQQLAYERAYQDLDPDAIDYVEAHGTATVLGDATEIETLDRFFAPHRAGKPLPIGSVKALIGHSLASAGLASLIKGVCMLRGGVIPPHIPVRPNARLCTSCLRLPASAEAWPRTGDIRRIAISSFGLGGANAHLIIGTLEKNDLTPACPRSRVSVAIMAVDATLGAAHGLAPVARLFDGGTPSATPFPWQRFSRDLAAHPERQLTGAFFPSQLPGETQGLRMGPKALARLDAFQRLGVHTVQQALAADGQPYEMDDMAVVFCSNLGGEMGLQLSRHYLAHFSGKLGSAERWAQLDPSLEAIASGLASLCSGFVAFHLGMKGFHETVSGEPGVFWQTLSLAPYWLERRCRSLVLAAGRHIKSPLDVERLAAAPGEGVVAFLLQSDDAARRTREEPLAVIRSFVPCSGSKEKSFARACADQGIDPVQVSFTEISQIRDTGELGTAQRVSGLLGEATGAEALLHLLLAPGTGWRAIEVRDGAEAVAHVLIEKLREIHPREQSPALPLPIEFQPEAENASAVPATPATESFLSWQHNVEAALVSYLRAQARLAALAGRVSAPVAAAPAAGRPLHRLRRDENHIVLESPLFENGTTGLTGASARLKVKEADSYFFDHQLDHVPGILILEGVLQIVELLMPEGDFILSIDLNFRKFCEKNEPILVRAQRRASSDTTSCDHVRYSAEVLQRNEAVARCQLETAPVPGDPALETRRMRLPTMRIADPKYVHKLHSDNVVITEIEEVVPGTTWACHLLPPPPGHILSEGSDQSYSLLYVFETTRQFVMLVAHTIERIPLGIPMNLAGIHLRLDRPVPRHQPLRFVCSRQPVHRVGQMTIANIAMELHGPQGRIGETAIKAQVVDNETYSRQRGFKTQRGGHK